MIKGVRLTILQSRYLLWLQSRYLFWLSFALITYYIFYYLLEMRCTCNISLYSTRSINYNKVLMVSKVFIFCSINNACKLSNQSVKLIVIWKNPNLERDLSNYWSISTSMNIKWCRDKLFTHSNSMCHYKKINKIECGTLWMLCGTIYLIPRFEIFMSLLMLFYMYI